MTIRFMLDTIMRTVIGLGKGPKIKKRESMVFDNTSPPPPLTLTVVFLFRIFTEIFFSFFLG